MTKTRILVVEDESITARDLQLTLQDLGYEVVSPKSPRVRTLCGKPRLLGRIWC